MILPQQLLLNSDSIYTCLEGRIGGLEQCRLGNPMRVQRLQGRTAHFGIGTHRVYLFVVFGCDRPRGFNALLQTCVCFVYVKNRRMGMRRRRDHGSTACDVFIGDTSSSVIRIQKFYKVGGARKNLRRRIVAAVIRQRNRLIYRDFAPVFVVVTASLVAVIVTTS